MPDTKIMTNPDAVREDWLGRLNALVNDIETWAGTLDWVSRRIKKSMKDSLIGPYQATGLLMQKEFTRILLDPMSRSTPGSEGSVDLYLMPGLDDIASLYFYDGRWNLHYQLPNSEAAATLSDASAEPLTKESLAKVLEKLAGHVA